MSAAAGSANKANVFNEETEALYDPHPGFTAPAFYTDISWPEWNDAELNAEAWDEGKGRAGTAVGGKKDILTFSSSFFNDSSPPSLPLLIEDYVYCWKRPQEVFENTVLSIYDPTNSEFVVSLPSAVACCDFFKSFCEQLPILQFYALRLGFPVEGETAKFVANTQGEPWRPWHHVYALCKAGKGQIHKPLYCPYGKYVVRLFYMGIWRRIVVDDKIPCDQDGNCMLPTTQVAGELWPIILIKALLKIASLTPSYDFSATDFPLLSFFTGWAQGSFTAVNKTDEQIWRRLAALVPTYELPEEPADLEAKSIALSARNLASKRESKKESRPLADKRESQTEKFCFLLAALNSFPDDEDLFEEYTMAVTMIRDCPLNRVSRRESTKPWKRIRWVYWAKEKGLWTDESLMPPYRRVKNITFVKELAEFLAPDPKQEAVLYDVPEDDEGEEEDPSEGEDKFFEPEQWCDFLKFKQHLNRMYIFLKPTFMTCAFKVTCLKEGPLEAPTTGKSTGKTTSPQNFYSYPPVLKPTYNEPLFLFCESAAGIFLCFSFSICPKKPKTSVGYLEGDHPELLKISHGSLVVEDFLWTRIEQGEIIGAVRTVGNSTLLLNLKPGRHVLKLWLISDSPYVLDVYSNVNVVVHRSSKIRFLMTNESDRISNYIANVSNAFISLTLKFGKSDLPSALHDFYSVIRPGNEGMIGYRSKIDDFIETFLNCVLLSLKDLIPSTDELKIMMWALQSLFFNPNIRCDLPSGGPPSSIYGGVKKAPPKKIIPIVRERTLSEILEYSWTADEIDKVVLIQRVFRGFKVRLLWKYQAPARKEFKPYVERLKKIADALFAPPKREQEVGLLLRRIVMAKPDLLTTFRFHEDLCNVLQVEEHTGKLANVEPNAWVPITRFVVACHSEDSVPCAFYFSCNLENFVIQGFDNDTNKELFRVSNAVCPYYYRNNVRGYTIFAFGWNEATFKTVNWKLELVKMKYFRAVHLCNLLLDLTCHPYTIPSLDVLEVRNFYIPNSKKGVCRCFIKVQKRTLLTLRFSASYSEAHFLLVVSLDKSFCSSDTDTGTAGKTVAKATSTNGAILMSSLVLDFVESPWCGEYYPDTESTVYVLEVSVLDNSWPLTKQEWGVVEPLRVNGESWKDSTTSLQSRKGGSDSRKKLTRLSRRTLSEQKPVENPFWLVQVINDSAGSESGDAVSIEEDKSHAESVKAMKQSWEEKDPGRRKRGREMRMRFLYAVLIEEKKNYVSEEGDYGEFDYTEKGNEELQLLLEQMSSFTYLTNDTSPTRYTHSPRTLPVVPLFRLLCKYSRLKDRTAFDASEENVDGGESSVRLRNIFEELNEERRDFLNQCTHFRSVMTSHTNAEQKLSNQLMEEAYESRSKAIERMMR